MFQVYAIVNLINSKIYVGCTTSTLKTRFRKHISAAYKQNKYTIQKAIVKYGKDNFAIRKMGEFSSKQDMIQAEIYWIKFFNTYRSYYGYNETLGGELFFLGRSHSIESKLKMSLASKNKPKSISHRKSLSEANIGNILSEETKIKLSKIMKDKKHRVGSKSSVFSKKKMSDAHKGKTHSTETRQKMSDSKKDIVFTEDHKKNLSKSLKGKSHSNKGKPWSQARRDAQSRRKL